MRRPPGRPAARRCYLFGVRRLVLVTALLVPVGRWPRARGLGGPPHRFDARCSNAPSARCSNAPTTTSSRGGWSSSPGADGRARLRERFRARAERAAADRRHAPRTRRSPPTRTCCPRSVTAKAAAAAFDQALRVAPQSVPRARRAAPARSPPPATTPRRWRRTTTRSKIEQRARSRGGDSSMPRSPSWPAPAKPPTSARRRRHRAAARAGARRTGHATRPRSRLADALERAGKPGDGAAGAGGAAAPGPRRREARPGVARRAPAASPAAIPPTAPASRPTAHRAGCASFRRGDAERRRAVWTVAFAVARSRGTLSELARELERAPGPGRMGRARAGARRPGRSGGRARGDARRAGGGAARRRDRAPRGRALRPARQRAGGHRHARGAGATAARRFPACRRSHRSPDRGAGTARRPPPRSIAPSSRFARKPQRAAAAGHARLALGRGSARAQDLAAAAQARSRRTRSSSSAWANPSFRSARRTKRARPGRRCASACARRVRGHLRLAEVLLEHDLDARRDRGGETGAGAGTQERRAAPAAGADLRTPEEGQRSGRRVERRCSRSRTASFRATSNTRALRREARVRLLGLLMRQGRGRMDAQIRQLRDDARAHPDDLEIGAVPRGGAAAHRRRAGRDRDAQGAAGAASANGARTRAARDVAVEAGVRARPPAQAHRPAR